MLSVYLSIYSNHDPYETLSFINDLTNDRLADVLLGTAGNYFAYCKNNNGFADINPNANYSGTNTGNLPISNVPSCGMDTNYRCVEDAVNRSEHTLQFYSH